MRFKPEQLNPDVPPPMVETEGTIEYLGVKLQKGEGGIHTPHPERFERDVITNYDLQLMQKIAVSLSLNQPVLLEGGSGIGKSQTVDRMCADLNQESYYANCHDYDADTLIGAKTISEDTKSGFGWKDGVIIQAARNGGILFLDEYNFMRGDTRGRLHEVLDAILREKGEIALTENDNEIVTVHPNFRIVAAQNPPGGDYGDREVLDPAQIDRFTYIKEPMKLSTETRTARLLGRLGKDNQITIPEDAYMYQGEYLTREQMAEIPGIDEIISKYVEVSEALQKEVEQRSIARSAVQPVLFGTPRDDNRVFEFVQNFYRGDITKTYQDALKYYYLNKVLDPVDRQKIESLIQQVKYSPPADPRRQTDRQPRTAAATPATPAAAPATPDRRPITPDTGETTTLEHAELIMGKDFLGPRAVVETFGFEIPADQIPEIPFAAHELEHAKKLGHQLVLYVDQMADGTLLTMEKMNEIRKGEASDGNKLLYSSEGKKIDSDAWYKKEEFLKQTSRLGWRLTSKEVTPESASKNYLQQTQVLVDYLREKVYDTEPIHEWYETAIAEFDSKKAELERLLNSDWQKAGELLEELQITKLLRETPVEMMYRLTMTENMAKDRLLASIYAWTSKRASDSRFVRLGLFDDDGLAVGYDGPRRSASLLGACFSRGV